MLACLYARLVSEFANGGGIMKFLAPLACLIVCFACSVQPRTYAPAPRMAVIPEPRGKIVLFVPEALWDPENKGSEVCNGERMFSPQLPYFFEIRSQENEDKIFTNGKMNSSACK